MGVVLSVRVVSWYNNSSVVSALVRVLLVQQECGIYSILVRARVLCAGHALLVSSYGSTFRELRTLCHRSSRACSFCFVALKA